MHAEETTRRLPRLWMLVPLALALAGCPRKPAGEHAATTSAPEAAHTQEATDAGPPVLPGHGDVLRGSGAAVHVANSLELPAGTIEYLDGPEYGRFRVQVSDPALQERVLEQLRQARANGDGKVWIVEFRGPSPAPGGEGPVLRTEELR